MTTIVIAKKNGIAAIAADTLSKYGTANENAKYIANHHKIVQIGENYIAITGASSAKLALTHYFSRLAYEIDLSSVTAIYKAWLDLHESLKNDYFLIPDADEDAAFESTQMDVLIANPYGIFGVSQHRSVQEFSLFYAYGSGARYALGGMYSVYNNPLTSVENVVLTGMEAAAEFDDNTGLPTTCQIIPLKQT